MSKGAGNDRSSSRGEPEPHGDPDMTVDHFDALETARDLETAGIERPHAEAITRAVGRAVAPLATKADIQRLETTLRGELRRHEALTKAESERIETTLRGDSERLETTLRGELQRHEASTKAESERLESTLRGESERLETTLRGELQRHEASTKAESERLESTLRGESERLATTLRGEFDQRMDRHEAWTRTELANLRADLYRALWIQGAGIVAIVAALKLVP